MAGGFHLSNWYANVGGTPLQVIRQPIEFGRAKEFECFPQKPPELLQFDL